MEAGHCGAKTSVRDTGFWDDWRPARCRRRSASAQVLMALLILLVPFALQRHGCWPGPTAPWAQILGAAVWLPLGIRGGAGGE